MTAQATFPAISLQRSGGKGTVEGELVLESSTAYQVAIDGVVASYYKDQWSPLMDFSSFSDFLGGMFK